MGKSTKSPRTGGRLDEPEGGYSAWSIDRWCSCRIRLDWSRTVFRGQGRLSQCKLRERRRSCQRAFRARSGEAGGTRLQRRAHADGVSANAYRDAWGRSNCDRYPLTRSDGDSDEHAFADADRSGDDADANSDSDRDSDGTGTDRDANTNSNGNTKCDTDRDADAHRNPYGATDGDANSDSNRDSDGSTDGDADRLVAPFALAGLRL